MPENLKFARHLRFIIRNGRNSLNFVKPVFDFSILNPSKSGLSKKLSVHIGYSD